MAGTLYMERGPTFMVQSIQELWPDIHQRVFCVKGRNVVESKIDHEFRICDATILPCAILHFSQIMFFGQCPLGTGAIGART